MVIDSPDNRRGNLRLVEKLPVRVLVGGDTSDSPSVRMGSTKNISETGLSITTDTSIPGVDSINIEAILPQSQTIVRGTGKIVWRDDISKVYGVHFIAFDDDEHKETFRRYVNRSTDTREILIDRREPGDRRQKQEKYKYQEENRILKYRRNHTGSAGFSERLPRMKKDHDYDQSIITKRLRWLQAKTGSELKHVSNFPYESTKLNQNIENLIGITSIPLGVAGPILVQGQYAQGLFYVPMATTQGTMVECYHRGALLVNEAGGARVTIHKDEIHLDPVFTFSNLNESVRFIAWVRENEEAIKNKAKETTRHGQLIRITCFPIGNRVAMNFAYTTGDAMGLNMINIATDHACHWICDQVKPQGYFLRSNFSSDKKPSFYNFINGYGKDVTSEVILPRTLVKRYMRATPEHIYSFWYSALLSGMQAGMIGINAHFANGLSAIFVATGQDVAQVVNGSHGILTFEITAAGDLKVTTKFPQLLVGTVGGGTTLPPQQEALRIMGCVGDGKAKKFAEIIAAILLAGEISICGALASGEFAEADLALRERKVAETKE